MSEIITLIKSDPVTVEYAVSNWENRQDSAFYTWGDVQTLAWVRYTPEEGEEIEIYVVVAGEMRLHYDGKEIRNAQQLEEAGITTDSELYELGEAEKLEWENNSWYEILSENEELDEVHHTLSEAVNRAKEIVREMAEGGGE